MHVFIYFVFFAFFFPSFTKTNTLYVQTWQVSIQAKHSPSCSVLNASVDVWWEIQ